MLITLFTTENRNMRMKSVIFALTFCTMLTGSLAVYAAEDEHKHEAKEFASLSEGLGALESAVSLAKSKVAAGDLKALGKISEELKSTAGGLRKRTFEIANDGKDRFRFNVDQVEDLHEQLESAEKAASKAEAERVVKGLEDVMGRLKSLAVAK